MPGGIGDKIDEKIQYEITWEIMIIKKVSSKKNHSKRIIREKAMQSIRLIYWKIDEKIWG